MSNAHVELDKYPLKIQGRGSNRVVFTHAMTRFVLFPWLPKPLTAIRKTVGKNFYLIYFAILESVSGFSIMKIGIRFDNLSDN